eukprot:2195438-Rhodomonas_salina.5
MGVCCGASLFTLLKTGAWRAGQVQAERRRWEQRMEEAERQRTKKLEEAERARSTEQSRERQKLEEAERERIKEQRQLRADKEAAEAKNAELQVSSAVELPKRRRRARRARPAEQTSTYAARDQWYWHERMWDGNSSTGVGVCGIHAAVLRSCAWEQARAKALSEQVEAMEKYQGRWEGQRTAVEKERQEMQKTIDKLKYELMGALKKVSGREREGRRVREWEVAAKEECVEEGRTEGREIAGCEGCVRVLV